MAALVKCTCTFSDAMDACGEANRRKRLVAIMYYSAAGLKWAHKRKQIVQK